VALTPALQKLGCIERASQQIDYRSSEGNADRGSNFAAELLALNPDLLVASGTADVQQLLQATQTVLVHKCLRSMTFATPKTSSTPSPRSRRPQMAA
jgi:hypothetical protein